MPKKSVRLSRAALFYKKQSITLLLTQATSRSVLRTNLVSVLLTCRKHRFEEAVDDGDLRLVGNGNKRGPIVELHHGGLLLVEFWPFGQAFSVRVAASLGKVYPVLLHQFAYLLFLWESVCYIVECYLKLHHIVGMGCTPMIALGLNGGEGLLG